MNLDPLIQNHIQANGSVKWYYKSPLRLSLVLFFLLQIRSVWIIAGGEDRILVNLPDDAFYYFVLAKNHAALGRWTFDGTAPATGFHILWAYIISTIYEIGEWSLAQLFCILSLINSVAISVAAWGMFRTAQDIYAWPGTAGVFFVFVGTSFFLLPSMGMEASLVAMLAALCLYLVLLREVSIPAFTAGLLGEFSRSDFGLVPLSLLVAIFIAGRGRDHLRPALACFFGALFGLLLSVVHTYGISGQWIQNSALMKEYWSSLAGHPITAPFTMLGDVFLLGAGLFGALFFSLLGLAAGLDARQSTHKTLVWLTSAFVTAGYVMLYKNNSQEIQPWYLASFVIPSVVFVSGAISLLSRSLTKPVLVFGLALLAIPTIVTAARPIWPHMLIMAEAGQVLNKKKVVVGSWNAGVIGYFNFGRTVNLDGLVNDDIFPYAKSGRLLDYVRRRDIGVIADFEVMFDDRYARRGGYSDKKLSACLEPIGTIDLPVRPWRDKPFRFYRIRCFSTSARNYP